jgi:hypothetical protein
MLEIINLRAEIPLSLYQEPWLRQIPCLPTWISRHCNTLENVTRWKIYWALGSTPRCSKLGTEITVTINTNIHPKLNSMNTVLIQTSLLISQPKSVSLNLLHLVPHTHYAKIHGNTTTNNKQTPWSESASELYRLSDCRLSAKWLPTFADKGCHVVSVTDPCGRILGFLDRSRYFSIK